MSRKTAIAASVLLAACTPMQWMKAGADPAEFRRDLAECQREAWLRSYDRAFWADLALPRVVHDRQGRPIVLRAHGPFSDPIFVQGRLEQFCMQDKGYRLVPAEPSSAMDELHL